MWMSRKNKRKADSDGGKGKWARGDGENAEVDNEGKKVCGG